MLLKPGKTCDDGIKFFTDMQWGGVNDCRNAIPNPAGGHFSTEMNSAILKYTEWTDSAAKQVREVVDDPEVAGRIRSETYYVLMASDLTSLRTISMFHTELQELSTFFMDCANQLRAQKELFKGHTGRSLVLDTNDFLHYQRFDKISWASLYGDAARLLIPHVVVDEIDTKSYGVGTKIARRARGVYRVLEGYLDQIDADGYATLADGTTLEILADEPGHRRMPNNDDEVVARAAFVQQAIAPSKVTVITRDIGMRTRARTRLLNAEKLSDKYLIPEDQLAAGELDSAVTSIELSAS
jgi:rRNA-processing protein FCF1